MADGHVVLAKWKALIDGVEVPVLGVSFRHGIGANAFASLRIEPDPVLRRVPRNAHVALFFRDDVDPELRARIAKGEHVRDEEIFKLYFEGETVGRADAVGPDARHVEFTVAGELLVLSDTKMFMGGVGQAFETPLVSGSFLFGGQTDVGDVLVKATLGEAFKERPGQIGCATRIVQLINYLCSFNASARLRAVRKRLLGRLQSIDDDFLGKLIQFSLAGIYMSQTLNTIGPESTFMDVINQMNTMSFHTVCPIPAPYLPGNQPLEPVDSELPGFANLDPIYSIKIPYRRNDFIFAPNLYYAMPPASNLIFPDMITSLSASWDYAQEPTRLLIEDRYVTGGAVGFLAPQPPIRDSAAAQNPVAASVWATSLTAVQSNNDADVTSPYEIVAGNQRFNGLQMLRDEEIERGIILSREFPEYEFFTSLAAETERELAADPNATAAEAHEAAKKSVNESVDNAGNIVLGPPGARWVRTMNLAASYQLELQRNRRNVTVTCVGLRHLIPGFPTIIFGKEVSYHGRIASVSLNVDPDGLETTTIELDYAREIQLPATRPPRDFDLFYRAIRVLDASTQKVDTFLATVREQFARALNGKSPQTRFAALTNILQTADRVGAAGPDLNRLRRTDPGQVTRDDLLLITGSIEARAEEAKASLALGTSDVLLELIGVTDDDLATIRAFRLEDVRSSPDDPAPPPHFPIDFVRNSSLNARYRQLFGYEKDLYPESVILPSESVSVRQIFNPEQQDALRSLDRIFPLDPIRDPGSLNTSEWAMSGKDRRSRLDWEMSTYHWRPAQSMRDWAGRNELILGRDRSDAGQSFFVARPVSAENDNSILSKVVDDRGGDPLIAQIRAEIAADQDAQARLTTAGRQQVWLNYARRHFGGRAFPGN